MILLMGVVPGSSASLSGELGSLATLLRRVADSPTASPEEILAGLDDPDLEIERQLGAGGMGMVFLARDVRLDRRVAVKVHRFSGRPDAATDLLAEAQAMARLAHPNVVALHEVRQAGEHLLLMMEFIPGRTLRAWLTATPRTRGEILDAFAAAGAGLAAAHRAGLVHRDFKPDNVIVGDDGRTRVADFGLARVTEGARPATTSADDDGDADSITGTPAYLAPEQLEHRAVDARTDQYAFCLTLAEALQGRHPLADSTPAELFDSSTRDRLPGSPAVAGIRPAWLRRIVVRGLAPDPADRYADMEALLGALARGRRRRTPWIAAAVGLAAAAGVAAWVLARRGGPDCGAVDHQLDGIWDAAARTRAGDGIDGLGLPYGGPAWRRIEGDLDGYARRWTVARRDVCRAGGRAGDALTATLARQTACLDQRRAALGQLARTLAAPDRALLDRAGQLAGSLPPVDDCADLRTLAAMAGPATPPPTARDLAAARAAYAAGHYQPALDAARRAVAGAGGARDVAAEATLLSARALLRLDRVGDAAPAYQHAADLAGDLGATPLQVDAWIGLGVAYQKLGQLDDSARTLGLADAALAAAHDPVRRGFLLTTQGTLAGRRGDYEGARHAFERALAEYHSIQLDDSPLVSPLELDLAISYRLLGRHGDALAHARRALEVDRTLGEGHPRVASDHIQLSPIWEHLGHPEMSIRELTTARAILTRAAPGSAELGMVEDELGRLASHAHHEDEAATHYRAAVDVFTRTAPRSTKLRTSRTNLGDSLRLLGRLDQAERLLRDVLGEDIAALGEMHPEVAHAHRVLGDVLADQGRTDDAIAALERARAIYAANPTIARKAGDMLAREAEVLRAADRWDAALTRDRAALLAREATATDPHLPAESVLQVADDELHLGRAARALAGAEDAAGRFRALHDDAGVALSDFTAARARWRLGRDREAALARARDSRRIVAAIAPFAPDLAPRLREVDAWLAARGR
jgi:eukaryotic-like serine/threonine-protein kinase